jgi:hypothetical protein
MLMPGPERGRFPSYAWAWPKAGRHLLLRAAIVEDLIEAERAFSAWLTTHHFNDVTFAEQRLLVAISARLPATSEPSAVRARLKGIERMLWTHSTMTLRAAQPALQALHDAGISVMMLKGAARAAMDMRDVRGRFASDVDLLVHPAHFENAYKTLLAQGWDHKQAREPHLVRLTGLNLYRGTHGDLDLHRFAFHQLVAGDADASALWSRATQTTFLGHAVSVPSPADRLLMAIAHGGIDGHQHSDWLVDCAALISDGAIDWPLFERLCVERRLVAHAAIALGYLHKELGVTVPEHVMARLEALAERSPLQLWSALLQAHPKREHTPLSAIGRGLARGHRQLERSWALSRLEGQTSC